MGVVPLIRLMFFSWVVNRYTLGIIIVAGIAVYHIPLSQPTSAAHWMRVYKAGGSLGRGQDLQPGPRLTTESIKMKQIFARLSIAY